MIHYASLIDGTRFDTVRRYLNDPHSEIRDVLFVAAENLLPEVARLLDAADKGSRSVRLRQWGVLLRSGQVLPDAETHGFGVDAQAIPGDTHCLVLYLPPVYLVHLPEIVYRQRMVPRV